MPPRGKKKTLSKPKFGDDEETLAVIEDEVDDADFAPHRHGLGDLVGTFPLPQPHPGVAKAMSNIASRLNLPPLQLMATLAQQAASASSAAEAKRQAAQLKRELHVSFSPML